MPRDRRSTSFTASASLLYGHMRRPPSDGPSTVLWIAMMALRPASLLWQNTTSSCPVWVIVSKIMVGSGLENGCVGAQRIVSAFDGFASLGLPAPRIASGRDDRG